MKNFIQPGKILNYTNAGSAIASGAVVPIAGLLCGVAAEDIGASSSGPLLVEGVVEVAKATPLAINQGARVFWDSGNSEATTTVGSNTLMGVAAKAAGSNDTVVEVLLVPLGDTEAGNLAQAAVVAALTEGAGALGGTNDGDLPSLTATVVQTTGSTGGTDNGAWEDTSTAVGETQNAGSADKADVDLRLASIANNFEEVKSELDELAADDVALRAAVRENAAKINAILTSIKAAGLMASS